MLIKLLKKNRSMQAIVVIAEVEAQGEYYSGVADIDLMPRHILSQFETYESLVNDRILSLLDRMEAEIDVSSFAVVIEDGIFGIDDLQIYPSSKAISFKMLRKL
jgi:hypothetical protein